MMFLAIEGGLVVLAVVLAFTIPNLGARWFEDLERNLGNLARQRGLSVITVGLTTISLRAALLPILPIPVPGVTDEYCYLLLSDTFAHGRLTNPTSPMWVHFESPFILWHPTYTTKFYPAQGLMMALGQWLLGHPFWGVWLSLGLMCAAITWMLQVWVGEGWALLGGFLAMIRLGTFSYWDNSYFGGAMPAIGGALVLGALPRMKQQHPVRSALLMGLGFAILANSRPYEGVLFGIPVAVAILVWLWRLKRLDLGRALKRAMVPLLAVLGLTLVAMGFYFWRTTGSPFNPTYLAYVHKYEPVPYFSWQSVKPIPVYRHLQLRRYFVDSDLVGYRLSRTLAGRAAMVLGRLAVIWNFYLSFVFTLPLLLVAIFLPYGFSWKNISSGTRFLLVVCGAVLLGNLLPIWYLVHYSAPITCAIVALVMIALRDIRDRQWHFKPTGLFVARSVPLVCVVLMVLRVAAGPLGLRIPAAAPGKGFASWCSQSTANHERAAMLRSLSRDPGGQLVIVHYNPNHKLAFNDWVYNRADLNSAKVIWADDMGPAKNQELIRYYKNRRVWLVDADDQLPKLEPYSDAADLQQLTPSGREP
jgi:hypothetical protein